MCLPQGLNKVFIKIHTFTVNTQQLFLFTFQLLPLQRKIQLGNTQVNMCTCTGTQTVNGHITASSPTPDAELSSTLIIDYFQAVLQVNTTLQHMLLWNDPNQYGNRQNVNHMDMWIQLRSKNHTYCLVRNITPTRRVTSSCWFCPSIRL